MLIDNNNFKDINFKNPNQDIVGLNAIDRSIDNITTLQIGSIPSFPEFSDNSGILFEQLDSITISSYRSKLQSALSKYDNRIIMDDLSITRDTLNPNQVNVTISYRIRTTNQKNQTTVKVNLNG